MKKYNRIMLGAAGCFSAECKEGNYIGCSFDIYEDLTGKLCDDWHKFNENYIPVYLKNKPDKTKKAAGLSCFFLWTICKGLNVGDTVICPNGKGAYFVGIITGSYFYEPDTNLPHRRHVQWLDVEVRRADMSTELKNSSGSIGTCCDISSYAEEIEQLISISKPLDIPVPMPKTESSAKKTYLERDLHKILCNYNASQSILTKTIYHEHSQSSKDSNRKWVHPDLVGVRFADFKKGATSSLQKAMDPKKAAQIFSFEMKRTIDDDYSLKQYFFQALSNSSWANYGYLVAYEIDESLDEEIERLNAAFGIGVILLKAKPEDTKILCQAREKELDYTTIDKLCNLSPDFNSFIEALNKVLNATNEYSEVSMNNLEKQCDKIFATDEELEDYCNVNCIPF